MTFSTFTILCNLHHHLVPEHLYHPKRKSVPIKDPRLHPHPSSPLPSPWQPLFCFLSTSVDLSVLDILHKWKPMIRGLLCLALFSWHQQPFWVQIISSSLLGDPSSISSLALPFPGTRQCRLHLIRCAVSGLGLPPPWSASGTPH